MRTDLSVTQALQLAQLAAQFTPEMIAQYSLAPALAEEQLPGEPYYLIPDWDAVGQILSEFTGKEVVPPMSALDDPAYDLPITVLNGSITPDLELRVADELRANGFSDVTTGMAMETPADGLTRVIDRSGNIATAMYAAGLIGVGVESLDVQSPQPTSTPTAPPSPTPASTVTPTPATNRSPSPPADREPVITPWPTQPPPTATAAPRTNDQGIVIILGDDAPDPAYFVPEPVAEDVFPTEEEAPPVDPSVYEEIGE